MIHVNVSDGQITGSYGDTPFSVTYDKDLYDAMLAVAKSANEATDMETYTVLISEFGTLTDEDYTTVIQDRCEFIYINPATGEFFLKQGETVSNVPMPQALVDRIYESMDMDIDFMPLVKMWTRWLRNPILAEKGGTTFSTKFFNFVNMKYVHPTLKSELMEEHGLSEEIAEKRATMYQMKITNEGLLNGYKVSTEVMHKYDTETGEQVDRYKRTFNPDTGEIDSEGLPEHVEDRLFKPAMMGNRGDAFYCEGTTGTGLGHFIKVGCSHRLPSWDYVDTDDNRSCVKGLHVGGLKYIGWYSGEIHNVFIDPMHVGAVPDDVDGAIRCLQYFVHSSLSGVNGSIYHSSTYAQKTDEEWREMRAEILQESLNKMTEIETSAKQLTGV